jgi:hypothetical protein
MQLNTTRADEMPWPLEWSQRIDAWVAPLLDSYARWTGKPLIARRTTPHADALALFRAPFVVVSHGMEPDPILNFGNRAALELWETDWIEFTRTPSRLTAEPMNRAERETMLQRAASHGFIADYRGVRISMKGRRFLVEDALVWNVMDAHGAVKGQAATFSTWRFL